MSEHFQSSADRYPDQPGHRGVSTSIDAAEAIAPECGRLQSMALAAIKAAGHLGMTTNEIAAALDCPRDSIQPRTSELRARKLIVDSGQRRPNANGKRAIVWVVIGGAA